MLAPGMEWFWFVLAVAVLGVIGLTVGHKDDDDSSGMP